MAWLPTTMTSSPWVTHAAGHRMCWVHLDIAGKEMTDKDGPLAREGGVGFGVQLLEEWITGSGAA